MLLGGVRSPLFKYNKGVSEDHCDEGLRVLSLHESGYALMFHKI